MLKTLQKYFGVGDNVSRAELIALNAPVENMTVTQLMGWKQSHVRAVATGDKRCPRKGEWYISGAIPCAYKAGGNFTTEYYIAKLVLIRTLPAIEVPY